MIVWPSGELSCHDSLAHVQARTYEAEDTEVPNTFVDPSAHFMLEALSPLLLWVYIRQTTSSFAVMLLYSLTPWVKSAHFLLVFGRLCPWSAAEIQLSP